MSTMRWQSLTAALGWLVLAGCSDEPKADPEDPGPGCTTDPSACPAGTTCWPVDITGRYDCLSAPPAQTPGSPCTIELGQADCAEGSFCYPTAATSGICSPFCASSADCGGAACNVIWVKEAQFRYDVRVCAAAAPVDAGAD